MQIYAKGLTEIAIEQGPTILTQKFYEDHAIGRIPKTCCNSESWKKSVCAFS
jgi:hypothetical protein